MSVRVSGCPSDSSVCHQLKNKGVVTHFEKKCYITVGPIPAFVIIFFVSIPSQSLGPAHLRQYPPNPAMVMKSIITMNSPNGMMSRNQLTTINQSQLNGQLSLNMAGPNITHTSPSPPASKSATPSPSSSINEDEQDESNRVSEVRIHSAKCVKWEVCRKCECDCFDLNYWNHCRSLGKSDQLP